MHPPGDSANDFVVIYDGDCPLCRSYVAYSALKRKFPGIRLLDARTTTGLKAHYDRLGYDLNEGMVVVEQGRIFHAADAMARIALHTRSERRLNAALAPLLQRPRLGRLTYAVMRTGRSALLRLLRRPPL